MKIKWQKSDQHTDFGLFRIGDVIDTEERGISEEILGPWFRDGFAVEVKEKKSAARADKEV